MPSDHELEFDAAAAWSSVKNTARRMGEANDPAVYDALKAQFDHLITELKARQSEVPADVLADPLLRTQFVDKAKNGLENGNSSGAVEVVDELFGVKIEPRAIPKMQIDGSTEYGEEVIESQQPPTKEELAKIDDVLRRAKVAQMRGNREQAASLLKEAESLAPTSSAVLEAIGDELAASKKSIEARKFFDRARRADPSNLSAEKKFAESVFRTDAAKHIYTNIDDAEVVADPKKAAVLSYIVPGLGQLVTGQLYKGTAFVILWFTFGIGAIKLGIMVALTRIAGGGANTPGNDPNPLAYILGFAAIILYAVNVVDMASRAKSGGKRDIARPTPPESLPFE